MTTDILDLNTLENGSPGALERMTALLGGADLPFQAVGQYTEAHQARIGGRIHGLEFYRKMIETEAEWVECCLTLPDTVVSGRFIDAYLTTTGQYLAGDAINLPPERVARWHQGTAGAIRLERAAVIGGRGCGTYGHWLLDFIPQLLTLKAAGVGEEVPILVVNCPAFGRRFLKLMEIEPRCIYVRQEQTIHVGELYYPLLTKLRRRYSIEVLRRSFDHLLGLAEARGSDMPEGMTKLLIGRRKAPFAANFDDLREKLEPRGFTVFYPEDYPLDVQFRIFRGAGIVLGEDGSAMHNAGFCREDTPLILWSRGDKTNYWHGPVAQVAQARMHYLLSEPHDGSEAYDAPLRDILNLV